MNMAGELFGWLRPAALWLLLPWLLLVLLRRRAAQRVVRRTSATSPWEAVIDPRLWPQLRQTVSTAPLSGDGDRWRALVLPGLALLLILALAGPRVRVAGEVPPPLRPDVTRLLLIDLSPSFGQLDADVQQRVRVDLRQFVRALPAGETALAVVAGEAWLVVPPTEDVAALETFIGELAADAVPRPGAQPLAGLRLARRTLAASGARRQELYWLHAGTVPTLQGAVGESGISPKFLQASAGVDEWLRIAALEADAAAPGWRVSRLNLAPPPAAGWLDLGPILLLAALPLAAWLVHLPVVLWVWPWVFLAGAVIPGPASASAADAAFERGVADYRAGRYSAAAAAFAAAPADDPRAHYNRGNALARAGRLRDALAAYDVSLRLRPGDISTLHNRDLVARLLTPPKEPPPPPPPPPAGGSSAPSPPPESTEAERAAAQWLRRPPAGSDGLLRRKLALEEARRSARAAP